MPGTLTKIEAPELKAAILTFRDALRAHQEDLNRLNVYPVPDGDTGTNMALTLESVAKGLGTAESMAEVCEAISRGSLMGARGNSGVITSQILRGLADSFSSLDAIEADDLAAGLRRAADAAYQAVLRPVEGTILTVVRESAEAVERADGDARTVSAVLDVAAEEAHASVERTPTLLPVLAEAGVVDAGGKGFTLLLDSLLHVVDGRPVPEPELGDTPAAVSAHLRADAVSDLRYEVMYLLDAEDDTIPAFKSTWSAIGDSIVVVGGEGLWNCHVHTNDIGAAVEAGIDAGRPYQIRVTDLMEQVDELAGHAPPADAAEHEEWVREHIGDDVAPEQSDVTTAVVAVGVGTGVRRLLSSLGVQSIVAGGQSMNPSTEQILHAVERTRASAVIVLPNNKNIIPVAEMVDDLSERDVAVVPTTSVVEALGALVEYDPDGELTANLVAMSEAAQRVRSGEVTQAVRSSTAECGPIEQGDWLAIDRTGIRAAVDSPLEAVTMLLGHLVDAESEIVTVLIGADADPHDTPRIAQHVGLAHAHVEVEFHEGGQPLYPYLVGVE
jgi:DAK2 domain fusion protein YloV